MAMAMAMPMPEQKPEQLHLARLTVVLSGSISDPLARSAVEGFAQQITRVLEARHPTYAFPILDESVVVGQFHVEIEAVEGGSVRATLMLVGKILIGVYTGVAAYPSFKEAVPIIQSDIEHLLTEAAKHFDSEYPSSDFHFESSHVVLFKEEELEAELEALWRYQ